MFDHHLRSHMSVTLPHGLVLAMAIGLGAAGPPLVAGEDKSSLAEIEHFERHIRPLLHEHCYECHSADAKVLQGGLRLDAAAQLRAGGDSGPVLIPGKPDESLLIQSVRYLGDGYDMPPAGKLSDSEIELLVDWVARGAVFPDTDQTEILPRSNIDWEAGRQFWSFQPLARPKVPVLTDSAAADAPRPEGNIDAFVIAKLQQHGLSPSPSADRTTLIRRLSFNLIGLPPTPEEVDRFVADPSPRAYEDLIERLLASPQYGERWARLWLDLARYADTTESWLGSTPNSHLYRDWVVRAFNEDLPYDQFVRRQLATDHLAETGPDDLPALGFLGLSPTYFKELLLPPDIIKVLVADEWEERVDAVGRTFLGLTIACARCHDHKFDPISNEDYYALAGVFASTRMIDRPLVPPEHYASIDAAKAQVATLTAQADELRKKDPQDSRIAEIEREIAELKAATPLYDAPVANVVTDESLHVLPAGDDPQSGSKLVYRPEPQDLHLAIRGNPNRPGELVPRRFITVLSPDRPRPLQTGSGRADLAAAILNEAAPLAARVIVNRIWAAHFGRGLVDTPSNFGRLGSAPSHPELLEDLTARFVENGWSIKWLHREILHSATYRQSSAYDEGKYAVDPDNRWLWRMNRKRLEIEPWRDAMLAVAGKLDLRVGGPAIAADDPANLRRTLYTTVHRRELSKMLQLHDFPEPSLHSPQRMNTTTPLQGLYVLNSPFLTAQATALAERLWREAPENPVNRVQRAYRLLFARPASDAEVAIALDYLQDTEAASATDAAVIPIAWHRYTHALLGSNELLFVD